MSSQRLEQEIQSNEERLLHSDHQSDSTIVNELLTPDFEEISASGQVIGRDAVIAWLRAKDNDQRWQFSNFQLQVLSHDLVLAKYHAQQMKPEKSASLGSLRSSIWRKHNDTWQMVFHQATKVKS